MLSFKHLSPALASLIVAFATVRAQQPEYAQCGGIGWTGGTTCVAGTVCTYSNAYYSQCLPGTGSGTTSAPNSPPSSSPSSSSSAPVSTQSAPSGGLPFVGGVNTAGYDFSAMTDGSFTDNHVPPPTSQYQHFASQGANIFRIPFAWAEFVSSPGDTISSSFLSQYDQTVQAALSASTKPYVIIDCHNYARWNGQIIGQGGPTNAQFASLWSQLATHYANDEKIIFGVMNEPHDLNSVPEWATSVQAAVNAIRAAGATSQFILIPGSSWSSAQALPTEAGPYLLNVTDPAGGTNKLIFDVHKYLDSDNSGTHPDCTTNNVQVMETLVSWLQQNGNRQALLSETGGGNTASCETMLAQELSYIKQNSASIAGWVGWAAGSFNTSYTLTLTPFSNGTDQPLWVSAYAPNLP